MVRETLSSLTGLVHVIASSSVEMNTPATTSAFESVSAEAYFADQEQLLIKKHGPNFNNFGIVNISSSINISVLHKLPDDRYACDGYAVNHESLFLPLFDERNWPLTVRIGLYLFGLLNCFLGIGFAVEMLMNAAINISSTTIKVKTPGENGSKKVLLWNQTVAMLTLGCLATCVPEVMLNIIQTVGHHFDAGKLGPSTIIGSAAFNLMVTTAVCISAPPTPLTRRIHQHGVYATTTVFSIFAFLWVAFVLQVPSTKYIEVWEATITLCLFPFFVLCAYLADKRVVWRLIMHCRRKASASKSQGVSAVGTPKGNSGIDFRAIHAIAGLAPIAATNGSATTLRAINGEMKDAVATSIAVLNPTNLILGISDLERDVMLRQMQSRPAVFLAMLGIARLRDKTRQRMVGQHYDAPDDVEENNVENSTSTRTTTISEANGYASTPVAAAPNGRSFGNVPSLSTISIVEFASSKYAACSTENCVTLRLIRYVNASHGCEVLFETADGTAAKGSEFHHKMERISFAADEKEKLISVELVEGLPFDCDKVFYAKIKPIHDYRRQLAVNARIGETSVAEISFNNDVQYTKLAFKEPRILTKESDGFVMLERTGKVKKRSIAVVITRDETALAGKHYVKTATEIEFGPSELEKTITIPLRNTGALEKNVIFSVMLDQIEGAKLGERNTTTVVISPDDELATKIAEANRFVSELLETKKSWKQAWRDQFVKAANVNNADLMTSNAFDYVSHAIAFYWKLLYALFPPPQIWGGSLSYIVALIFLAFLTAVMGDIAMIFGCLCGLDEITVAVTFISVGTNLPDLFASRWVAIQDNAADTAIGHIQGSVCINVFLGLGIPWLIGSVYWRFHGKRWTVTIYLILSVVSTALLLVRRQLKACGNAVLGGPAKSKYLCSLFLFTLWLCYVILTALKEAAIIKGF